MISTPSGYLGVTPPISWTESNSRDLEINSDLEEYLRFSSVYESTAGNIRRRVIVDKLSLIVRNWVKEVAIKKSVAEAISCAGNSQIRIFGSQKLGVHTPEADIDVLCLAPRFTTRADFFASFCTTLSSRNDVSCLLPVPDAYTPVIKFNLDGQAIDMIFATFLQDVLPESIDLLDISCLAGLDEQSVRSLNGCRVAEMILQLVPNEDTFCTALRAIKHWARQRGLYSNILGFLGGVNYAILVAFICQRYIHACPATVVQKFFAFYSRWMFPHPVMLTHLEVPEHHENFDRRLIVSSWNPRVNPKDALHLMPIITPAFPYMNSAYNVTIPQYRAIIEELDRGHAICQQFEHQPISKGLFALLCAPSAEEFFRKYPRYVQVNITSQSAEEHRRWFGWCESRLRNLFLLLDQPPMIGCHPTANCFHSSLERTVLHVDSENEKKSINCNCRDDPCSSSTGSHMALTLHSSSFFIGLSFNSAARMVDLTPTVVEFRQRVMGWAMRRSSMAIHIHVHLFDALPSFVFNAPALPSSTTGCTPVKRTAAARGEEGESEACENSWTDNCVACLDSSVHIPEASERQCAAMMSPPLSMQDNNPGNFVFMSPPAPRSSQNSFSSGVVGNRDSPHMKGYLCALPAAVTQSDESVDHETGRSSAVGNTRVYGGSGGNWLQSGVHPRTSSHFSPPAPPPLVSRYEHTLAPVDVRVEHSHRNHVHSGTNDDNLSTSVT